MTVDNRKEYRDMMITQVKKHEDFTEDLRAKAGKEKATARVEDDLRELERLVQKGKELLPGLETDDDSQFQTTKEKLDETLEQMGKTFDRASAKLT
ncbi:MAG: hypothetical protein R6X25_03855 [Candidatus Krumholzibacteriia bacterium]